MSTPAAAHADLEEKHSVEDNDPRHDPGSLQAEEEYIPKSDGVRRAENIARAGDTKQGKRTLYIIAICVFILYTVYSIQSSTTYAYEIWATSSFQSHSGGLAATTIATGLISSVSLPFLAKLCDVFSRPYIFTIVLVAYVVGFILILKAPTLTAYIIGQVFVALGTAGLQLITSILAADFVPLRLRGMAQGILSSPYIVTPWFTAEIVAAFSSAKNWRWGYGIFAIIFPVVFIPPIGLMIWLDRRAQKAGVVSVVASNNVQQEAKEAAEAIGQVDENGEVVLKAKAPFAERFWRVFHELDTIGLLLLGFGWTLLLLPFSLQPTAKDGYKNPSLIAMFAVGSVCLIAYVVFERFWARFPTAPLRLLKNKTFITAIIIDIIYMLAGYMQSQYLTSYAYIVTDWTPQEFTYYGNILSVSLCFFGVIAGILMRYTHRYKLMQIIGLIIKLVAYGMLVNKNGVRDEVRLIISQILVGLGGSFSVVASQVSSQASVPHQDVALVISLLSLWTAIGRAVGSTIAVGVWSSNMPRNLREYVPSYINDTQIADFYADITTIKAYDFNSDVRQGAIRAYELTVFPLWGGALGLSFIAIIAACFQTNYYLGDSQNAYDFKDTAGRPTNEEEKQLAKPKTWGQKLLRLWDQ